MPKLTVKSDNNFVTLGIASAGIEESKSKATENSSTALAILFNAVVNATKASAFKYLLSPRIPFPKVPRVVANPTIATNPTTCST